MVTAGRLPSIQCLKRTGPGRGLHKRASKALGIAVVEVRYARELFHQAVDLIRIELENGMRITPFFSV